MGNLVQAGLVEARTGRYGVYRLSRPRTEINLLAVVEAVEGDSRRRSCVLRGLSCSPDDLCTVHDVFAAAHHLATARLADLVGAEPKTPE